MSETASIASAIASGVSALVAVVLAVITYKYLVATREIREATLASFSEAQRQREDSMRPVVDLLVPDTSLGPNTTVEPRGPGPALGVTVRLHVKTMVKTTTDQPLRVYEETFFLYGPISLGTGDSLAQAQVFILGNARMWVATASDQEASEVSRWATYADVYGRRWRSDVPLLFHEPPRKGSGYAEAFWYVISGPAQVTATSPDTDDRPIQATPPTS